MKWRGRRGSSNVRTSSGGGKMIGGGYRWYYYRWYSLASIWSKPYDGTTDWTSGCRWR